MPQMHETVGRKDIGASALNFSMGNCLERGRQLPKLLMLQTPVHITLILFFFDIGLTRQIIHPNEFWLPEDVVPIRYTLSLQVDMEKHTTEGRVSIWLKVVRPTKQITFHVHPRLVRVKEKGVRVIDMGTNRKQTVRKYTQNKTKEFGTVNLAAKLKAGTSVKLFLPFEGIVQAASLQDGLFLSEDGAGGWMAVTDFEPMSARKVRENLF